MIIVGIVLSALRPIIRKVSHRVTTPDITKEISPIVKRFFPERGTGLSIIDLKSSASRMLFDAEMIEGNMTFI